MQDVTKFTVNQQQVYLIRNLSGISDVLATLTCVTDPGIMFTSVSAVAKRYPYHTVLTQHAGS